MLCLSSLLALAAPTDEVEPSFDVELTYVVVASEKTYAGAMKAAVAVSDGAKIPLWFRGVLYDPNHKDYAGGLTYTKEQCGEVDGYPCYYPRGRVDSAGEFVSIEHTDAGIIQGFTPGLYLVVAATGTPSSLKPTLAKVKKVVPDAYLKTVKVYMGCLH